MDRPRTPPMNTFSGMNYQQPMRRMLQVSPQYVPGQTGETNLDYIRQQGNETVSNLFGRLNLNNQDPPGSRPRVNRQQRIVSRRRTTKFWKFTRSGKRKSVSRGSFLKRRRKLYKRKSRKSRSRKSSRRSRKSHKSSRKRRICKHLKYKNIRTPKKNERCSKGWQTKYI